jgi:hypothetical protein
VHESHGRNSFDCRRREMQVGWLEPEPGCCCCIILGCARGSDGAHLAIRVRARLHGWAPAAWLKSSRRRVTGEGKSALPWSVRVSCQPRCLPPGGRKRQGQGQGHVLERFDLMGRSQGSHFARAKIHFAAPRPRLNESLFDALWRKPLEDAWRIYCPERPCGPFKAVM